MTLRTIESPSPNFNERRHPLDMLVLHYTGMADGPSALARMRDPEAEVSAHYMVEEDGSVHVLVPEAARAWHAGRSQWQGDEDLNSRSIGIEIVNGGHDFGLPAFPERQIDAVIALCLDVLGRWDIPQTRIVGHSDIAPERKDDPGERFPWRRLAEAGIGLWPREAAGAGANPEDPRRALREIGYRPGEREEQFASVLRAFQRRWRQGEISGVADEETLEVLGAVAELYRRSVGTG